MVKFRKFLVVCTIVSLCFALTAIAQDAPPAAGRGEMGMRGAAPGARGAAPGARGMRGMFGGRGARVTSPEVADDKKVTFRISAPDATSVSVSGDWGGMGGAFGAGGAGIAMTKDPNGLWSLTVGPLEPELYGYTFNIDGARVWDPSNNDLKRDGSNVTSVFIVPGQQPDINLDADLYTNQDVPRGTLAKLWYESPTLNLRRRMYVYTPPGYYDGDERYPVLYLLHGAGGDEDAWTSLGRAPQILDNLIAQGKAKPMLVVMTNGNGNQASAPDARPAGQQDAGRGGMMGMRRGAAPAGERGAAPAGERGERGAAPAGERGAAAGGARRGGGMMGGGFPDSVAKDVVPFIEKNFRVLTDKSNRAIAGLSMGGGHTVSVTLSNPTMFDYIGVFSGAVFGINEEGFDALAAENPKLYWIGCGESDGLVMSGNRALVETVKNKGFNYEYLETPGGHSWNNWRLYLSILAQKLFK